MISEDAGIVLLFQSKPLSKINQLSIVSIHKIIYIGRGSSGKSRRDGLIYSSKTLAKIKKNKWTKIGVNGLPIVDENSLTSSSSNNSNTEKRKKKYIIFNIF